MIKEHFITISNQHEWEKYLPARRSVFGSFGYARICKGFRSASPRLFVLESGEASISYPMLFRSLADLPFRAETRARWDVTTPDFTGPLMCGSDPELAAAFANLRNALFDGEGVVAEFAHLHPWSKARNLLEDGCDYNRDIVWVDTSLSPEKLWRDHFKPQCRQKINQADREGVKIVTASGDHDVREFYRVYRHTMERNQAEARYYFSYEFFLAFHHELPENSRFVLAVYRDQIVAGTLCLYDDNDAFYFLTGADASFHHVRPTNAVVWELIRWAHQSGKKRLVLGGGYTSNDGIFGFKSSFSRFRQAFYIYKRIHLQKDYALLKEQHRRYGNLNGQSISYFPTYRCPVPAPQTEEMCSI